MPCFFAAVELFDPNGQSLMETGEDYGGETRLFVLQSDDLADALAILTASVDEHRLILMRLLHAGAVQDFDDEMLPFEVDFDTMVETAEAGPEICVSEPNVFEPDPAETAPMGVYAACLDLFDPDWAEEEAGSYAGHYQLVVISAATAPEALMKLLADCDEQELSLLGLEGFVDANAFPFDAYDIEFEEDDPLAEAVEMGGILWSNAYSYEPVPPRKLDS